MNVNVKQGSMWISQSNINQLAEKKNSLGRKCSKWSLAKRFIMKLLAIMPCIFSHAQEVMKIGSYIELERQYNQYTELVLPTSDTLASGWIYLEARGADGGRRYNNDHMFIDRHLGNGGEGATLGGWVKIKDDAEGCIPSGSKIRFIVGQSGQSINSRFDNGAGGGGGTGILFLPPNANNGEWQHLIIAGGGGGGYANMRGENGLGGRAYPDSTSGEASDEPNPAYDSRGWGRAAGWKYGNTPNAYCSGAEPGWRPNYGDWADWVKVYGKLKGISVADDGTVWGVNKQNEIYRRKDDDSEWEKVSGTFKQASVANNSTVWGVGLNNEIYRRKDDDSEWEKVPGTFKQVSVAADGTVWGVNKQNEIYRRKDDDSEWEKVPGALTQISHSSDNNVWGVNSKDEIFRRKADNSGWKKVPGRLRRISVAADGTIWGVNGKGIIYRRKNDDSCWIKMISCSNVVFKTVSAGSSTNIWALAINGDIYYCNGPSDVGAGPFGGKGASGLYPNVWSVSEAYGGWGYGGGGQGDCIYSGCGGGSCGGKGLHGLGGGGYSWMNGEYISKEFQMIRKDGRSGSGDRHHPKNGYAKYEISDSDSDSPFTTDWVKIGGKFKDISVADDGTLWGLDLYYEIYRRNTDDSAWERVPDAYESIVQLSHASYNGDVWGVKFNNEIYHRKEYNNYWKKVPGLLKQVSVAADGNVWGVNRKDEIYHRKDDDSAWEKVPGLLKQISVACESTIWGVNKKNEIYRRDYDNSSWEKIPGALKQVSVASDAAVWGVSGVSVWGVGTDNEIYYWTEDGSGWKIMSAHNHVYYTQVLAGRNTNIWALDINDNIYYYNSSNSLKSAEVATSNPDLMNGITWKNVMTNPIDVAQDKTGELSVKVYPNPASSFLTIEVSNAPVGDILCSLFNVYGHLVVRQSISSGTIQLNVSGFPKGLYTVVIIADGVKTVEKLMID